MIALDNQSMIRSGLKTRSNYTNSLINGPSHNNQDIIKQTLDIFQTIKRSVKKHQTLVNNEEEKQKRSSTSSFSCASDDELTKSEQELNLADEDTDTSPSNDYHSVWDNTDFILNGILDLDELNLFQLYKLRSQNYPSQKSTQLTNQKIIANFQKLSNVMTEMRNKMKQKHNNGTLRGKINNDTSAYEFNDNDWKSFQNDNLQVHSDFMQSDHFKKFEEYYNNFINVESNKMRNTKFNRYEKAILTQGNNSIMKQSFKVPEKLKKKLFMEEDKDNVKQNDTNQQKEGDKTQIKQQIQQINLDSEKTINNSICNFAKNISIPQDKLHKDFKLRKISPSRNSNTERSLNSSPTKKDSRDDNTPTVTSFRNIQVSNNACSSTSSSSSNIINLEKGVGSIDQSIGKQNIQLNFGSKQFDNNLNRNNNNINYQYYHSLNNFDLDERDDQTQNSCSPLKMMHNRFKSQDNFNIKQGFKITPTQNLQEQTQPPKDKNPIKKSFQTQYSSNRKLSTECVASQIMLLSNNKLDSGASISPQKGHLIQQADNGKNQILKNPQFNHFSFKTQQQQNQQNGKQFLPKIGSLLTNGSEIQKPTIQNNSEYTGNKIQKVDLHVNDKRCLSSSKSNVKQAFFENKVQQNECQKKSNPDYFNC